MGEQDLRRVFLMTNAAPGGQDVKALISELGDDFVVVQAPVIPGDRMALQQLCIEMAIASEANFFVAFGDGLVTGMASMPSLLVLQMRLRAYAQPLESHAFAFVAPWQDNFGL